MDAQLLAECGQVITTSWSCIDRRRFAEAAACYAIDGIFHRADGSTVVGRLAIEAALAARPATLHTLHQLSPPCLERGGSDEVIAVTSFASFALDGAKPDATLLLRGAGFFHDRLRQLHGVWQIAERHTRLVGTHTAGG